MRNLDLYRHMLRKHAAAVLTPEAEQAAVQGGMPPQGMPPQGMPPQGMPPQGMPPQGMPPQGMPPQGGMLPPEILNDQMFLQMLAQQGVQIDPNSGQAFGPDGQPIPPEMILGAYQEYMQMQQGGMPPQGMPPQGMPPQGMPPQGMPLQGGMPPQGGMLPPEILNDQMFLQFMAEAVGAQLDPSSGMFMTPQGPLPPEAVMQMYASFQQQMGAGMGAGMGAQGAAPAGAQPMPAEQGAQGALPSDMVEQLQSMIDASLDRYTAQLDKKLETMMDRLDTVKMALESMRDTDDMRTGQDIADTKAVQEELAAELMPQKTAAFVPGAAVQHAVPVSIFDILVAR